MEKLSKDHLVTIGDIQALKEDLLREFKKIMLEQSSSISSKKWLKSAEVRKLLGFSPGKLQTIRDSGLLAYTKIGGNIYYDADDLSKLFKDRKIQKNN